MIQCPHQAGSGTDSLWPGTRGLQSPGREESVIVYHFKTFNSQDCDDDIQSFEARVNTWIEEERPRIRMMCQTPIGNHVLLSFVFEVISEADDQPAKAITTVPEVFQETLEDTYIDPNEPPVIGDPKDFS
jgi:hypothetical protein